MQGEKFRRGPWLKEEDDQLTYLSPLWGNGGLRRSGKSCRLRWLNYLRPNLKRGPINIEERIILHLHGLWGNKLSRIARMLPGGTDNEVKNYLRTHLRKKAQTLEGSLCYRSNCTEEDLFFQNCRSVSKYYCENKGSGEDLCVTTNESFEAIGSSKLGLASSPYETQLLDWISELPNDQNEINHHDGRNSLESGFRYLAWTPEDDNIWDYPSSLWEME